MPNGREIITEGDLVADYFYIVQEGSFEIFVSDQGDDSPNAAQSAEKARAGGDSAATGGGAT